MDSESIIQIVCLLYYCQDVFYLVKQSPLMLIYGSKLDVICRWMSPTYHDFIRSTWCYDYLGCVCDYAGMQVKYPMLVNENYPPPLIWATIFSFPPPLNSHVTSTKSRWILVVFVEWHISCCLMVVPRAMIKQTKLL